jgi:tetratricopeptide (TPR) repeat protein
MKKILIVFLTSALVAPVLAQSAQPSSQAWSAISDGRRNYTLSNKTECPKLEAPGASQSDLTNVAGDPRSALNAVPEMTARLQEQIPVLEKQLAAMKADDPSRPILEAQLKQLREVIAKALKAPAPGKALGLEQTLAKLRTDLSRGLGSGSLSALDNSAEARNAGLASRGAYMAFWHGKPQASLGLLLRAAKLEPKNPAHLVNLSAIALYYGLHREALVLITAAEKMGGTLEPGVLLANKGHALLRATKYAEAEKVLKLAIAANPNLSEPRLNLAFAIAMQSESRCKEALEWVSRGWWRSNFSDALSLATRPLEQKFLTQDPSAPVPESVPMVLASFNGKPVTSDFYTQFIAPTRTAANKQLEVIKKVPLIAELRDKWLEGTLSDIIDTADMGVSNNSLVSRADQIKFEALRKEFGQLVKPQDETACAQVSQNLEMQDAIVRAAYQSSYRAAFAALARISDKTYRYWGQLQLAYIVSTFNGELIKLQDDALYKLEACSVQPKLEPVVAGEMPPSPKACVPQTASAAPKIGFALTVSCDVITLNFNPPAWIPRFQILKKGVTPLEDSQYDLRLTAFSSGGFGFVNAKGVLLDAGGTGPAAGKDFRHMFDSSKPAPVWFLSVERGAGH